MRAFVLVTWAAFVLLAAFAPDLAYASCEDALVRSTLSLNTTFHSDWRLAKFVSKDEYEQAKHDYGVNAVIYGVPVGANYDDFMEKYNKLEQSYHESLTQDESKQILWTGLDPNGANAYVQCLQLQVFNSAGLHLAVIGATKSEFLVKIAWKIPKSPSVDVTWSTKVVAGKTLETHFDAGEQVISIPRPTEEVQLVANAQGLTSEVADLMALPAPPPPSYKFKISGTVWHSTSAFDFSQVFINEFNPKLAWFNDGITGIYKYSIDIDELVNEKFCAHGKLTSSDNHFNTSISDSKPDFSPVFKGGSQVNKDQDVIEIFLDPKNDCS